MQKLHTRLFIASAVIPIKLLTPEVVAARPAKIIPHMPETNKSFRRQSAGIAALVILCLALVGCSLKPSLPPTEKLRATLDKVIKKNSPDATYSITSVDVHSSQKLIIVKLSFEDFTIKSTDGTERDFSRGKATASFDLKDDKWILSSFQTSEPDVALLFPELPVE